MTEEDQAAGVRRGAWRRPRRLLRLAAATVCALPLLVAAPGTSTAGAALAGARAESEDSGCTPGENGCLPTPEQCSTGEYNGFWEGRSDSHFAVCVGGGGQIISYVGGTTSPLCGLSIVAGVVVAQDEHGRDPNDCPVTTTPADASPSSLNMTLRANVPPVPSPANANRRQTDLAFWEHLALAGSDEGVRVIDISSPERPRVIADLDCYGPQGDVSVYEDLVVLSVDRPMTTSGCAGSAEAKNPTDPTSFEGLRVFRLSDLLAAPPDVNGKVHVEPVATVPVDCGSHTNTLLPQPDRVLVYVSATAYNPGPRCRNTTAPAYQPPNPAVRPYSPLHGKISIVEIPLADPPRARIVSEPLVEAPVYTLEPEEGTHYSNSRDGESISCHDITVSVELRRAAAACVSDGQLWDITDPVNPDTGNALHIDNRQVHFWHSAAFSSDGTVVVFGDEPNGGGYPFCRGETTRGRLWFYRVPTEHEADRTPLLPHVSAPVATALGSYQIPRSEGAQVCFAHNFNVVPMPGRDIAIVSAYGGGVSVVDFTYPDEAREIAYFDVDDPAEGAPSMSWSAYWYNGLIYSNDGLNSGPQRGFDVLQLHDVPPHGAARLRYLNPQTQEFLIRWR
jgi:hypothetical protein